MLNTGLNAVVGATIVYSTIFPLETLKLQHQLRQSNNMPKVGLTLAADNMWRGYTVYIVSYAAFFGIYNKCYRHMCNDSQQSRYYYADKFVKSNIASTIASGITNPLHVVRTRLHRNLLLEPQVYTNYVRVMRELHGEQGWRGFMRGFPATMVNNLKLGIIWPLNDYLIQNSYSYFASAAIATCVGNSLLYPTDVIRTTQRSSGNHMTIAGTARQIYCAHGVRGFYTGMALQMMYSGASKIMTLALINYLSSPY